MSNSNPNHSVERQIREIISHEGPIGIDVFTQYCLYEPQQGYYTTKNPIGAEGDFITAPEISQMFGEIIAKWII
jgi:SAM-dependent MidA family methyltransferase